MQSYKNPFLLADIYYDNDANSDSDSDKYDEDSSDDDTSVSDSNVENNNKNNKIQEYNSLKCYEMYTYNESDNSPKKINISKNNLPVNYKPKRYCSQKSLKAGIGPSYFLI